MVVAMILICGMSTYFDYMEYREKLKEYNANNPSNDELMAEGMGSSGTSNSHSSIATGFFLCFFFRNVT